MSVDQPGTIDLMATDRESGDVILTISDHLGWEDSTAHQQVLQCKLNSYLAFVEGGQLVKERPEADGKRIVFRVVCKYRLDRGGRAFLKRASAIIQKAGFSLTWEVFAESYDN